MGIHYEKTNIHWNYLLAIESDFVRISRYVEFTEENNRTFSIEFARILMAATQEVDVVLKQLCENIDPSCNPDNIGEYRAIITEQLPGFVSEEIRIPQYGMRSQPWSKWKEGNQNPLWWRANNKIKHDRINQFKEANLKNTYNAISGLFVATLYLYMSEFKKESKEGLLWTDITDRLCPKSLLFRLNEDYYSDPENDLKVSW